MEKKVFRVKDETLEIDGGIIRLLEFEDEADGYMVAIASTDITDCHKDSRLYDEIYLLPSTLIRKPKTDEELAEEYINKKSFDDLTGHELYLRKDSFLAGRKSVGREFHLTMDELEEIIDKAWECGIDGDLQATTCNRLISSITPPTYPTKITVDYDGENYLWETLKAEY